MDQTPTLIQVIKKAVENRLMDVHTALIGRIESYDHTTQLADIQPVLKRGIRNKQGGLKQEDLPLLLDIPVLFPRAGGFFLSLPIERGDFVQVIFNETSFDELCNESRFTLQGAIAIPGVYPFSKVLKNAHKNNLVIGNDNGVQIHIEKDMVRIGSDKADEALALASKVKDELEHIKSVFNSHSHIYHKAPSIIKMLGSSDVACEKVFVE